MTNTEHNEARGLRIARKPGAYGDGPGWAGFCVQTRNGLIVAGPYVTRDAAKLAKAQLVAGEPVNVPGYDR